MAITEQSNQRKDSRRQSNRRNDDKRIIKIEGAEEKEQAVTVRRETVPQEKRKSTWSWHEEFVLEWCETLITEKKSPK
jgi:hypothetical protein